MLVKSTMMKLGTKAPGFDLSEVSSGEKVSLSDFGKKKALLVMFICEHCPYVKHVDGELAKIGREYQKSDLGMVGICSNSSEYDSKEDIKRQKKEQGFVFPYLIDDTQEVAKAYSASCTPDFFLFDGDRKLVYRGQLDGSRPGNFKKVTGEDLRGAIEAVLSGGKVSEDQKPSSGCNIKWTPGNEPSYY